MILKSVKLENIRSYLSEKIEFPSGSVLLAGDIGSGKSTILQAVEFVLFGLKTDLPGHSLLRHGKKKGSVELEFYIDGKEVAIKRTLKRGKDSIGQESGHITINGLRKEGTATELKTAVLDLMGYPQSLVSKSKDLIYRYTVYTPQEEMKQILTEDKDLRLDTLRRVFGIDKYKRVRENAAIILKEIREGVKQGEGMTEDLEEKREERREKEGEGGRIKKNLEELLPRLKEKRRELVEREKKKKDIEKGMERLNQLKREFEVSDANLKNRIEQNKKNREQLERLKEEVEELKKDEAVRLELRIEDLKERIKVKENEVGILEREIRETTAKLLELEMKRKDSEKLKKSVTELNFCPVCRQKVEPDHKHRIAREEEEKIAGLIEKISVYKKREESTEKKIKEMKESLEELKTKEREFDLIKLKRKNLEDKMDLRDRIAEEQEKLKAEIGKINERKIELRKELEKFSDIEGDYNRVKEELEKISKEERELELGKVGIEKDMEGMDRLILKLSEEIGKKLKIKGRVRDLKEINDWVCEFFINLTYLIERQIMLKLYSEFNELFQNWFKTLIEDEMINVRLDEEFTPVIEQDGYETGIENLSGGERTSLALAYRLALNKVINDFIEEIKTKDIIILDEPTDGFSTEQLDKMRDVLEQLRIRQIIIVSHEQKVEGSVDNVIRISKEEHVSSVS